MPLLRLICTHQINEAKGIQTMKAKKNDTVYYAHRWNICNVAMVEELVVTSWGKKRAQAKHAHNDEMISKDLWLNDGDHAQVFATREEAVAKRTYL